MECYLYNGHIWYITYVAALLTPGKEFSHQILSHTYTYKPQSRKARLLLVASVWVMLHIWVKVHSPTPAPRAVAVRDDSLSQLAPRIRQFANCHHARPAAAVWYCTWVNWYVLILRTLPLWDGDPDIAGRLFNGLTANDCWQWIYWSQQRSLSLGKGLMLVETVAQTDGQTLPIFIYIDCHNVGNLWRKFRWMSAVLPCSHALDLAVATVLIVYLTAAS